ncbi:M30 family zinc metallopeptidase [Uliginosibacterium gangwonense]|uniref:M30 family zinc metallopeptidase n=1 Tax=Uliginosibacterium gangwonense TaxID=392736 RepID=UPI00037D5393|nr:PKD domain-containing protein [Uliginosibacterium gangwonense]
MILLNSFQQQGVLRQIVVRTALGLSVLALVSACGGGGGGGGGTSSSSAGTTSSGGQTQQAPSAPAITVGQSAPAAGDSVAFSATSTDPAGLSLTYNWSFGDNTATVTGQSVNHTFTNAGTYTVTATASNTASLSASSTKSVTVVAKEVLSTPTISASLSTANVGQTVTFTGSATDSTNAALTYAWNFGDNTTGSGTSVSHSYSAVGNYTVTLTVNSTTGLTKTSTATVGVVAATANALTVDCTGTNCGATSPTQYSGSGTGVWRYNNTAASNASVNINIAGVSAGKQVTLLFSNGNNAATTVPAMGTAANVAMTAQPANANLLRTLSLEQNREQGHALVMQRNKEVVDLLKSKSIATANANMAIRSLPKAVMPTPSLGTSRSWMDTMDSSSSPVSYATTAVATCSLPSGRNVVFWRDPNAASMVTDANISDMVSMFCGASTSGLARMNALVGDVWGSTATSTNSADLIQDGANLQDVNVVLINKTGTLNWCGYFSNANNVLQSSWTRWGYSTKSNEALVFFIDANCYRVSGAKYTKSSLLHEAMHMTNFYQRLVLRGTDHDTWLEETTAMMAEDIITQAVVSGYNPTQTARAPNYMQSGGGVSYVNWGTLTNNSYALGGSFGGFLNRRYGLSIFKQLVTTCQDGVTGKTSYDCLDGLIKSNNGVGFADEYARYGATIFSALGTSDFVGGGYGFPAKIDGGYTLAAVDLSGYAYVIPATATSVGSSFSATTHTYQKDTVASGKTTYARTGVVVPANTILTVIIK